MSRRDLHADHDRLREELAAYSLRALEPEETAEIEQHLERCESCREHLDWLRPAVDLLPASVEPLRPPESLRANLLATVQAEAAPADDGVGATVARPSWTRRLAGFMLRPAFALAALILLTVGLATGYLVRGAGDQDMELIQAQGLGPQRELVSATLERDEDSTILHVQEMPPLARDEVYEIWVERAGAFEPRNTFVPRLDGTAEAVIPGPLEGARAVLVTAEPRPGSRQPTEAPLLEAPLR